MHTLLDDGYKHTVDDVICLLNKWATYIHHTNPNKPLYKQFGKDRRDMYKRVCKYRHSKKSKWIGKRGRI